MSLSERALNAKPAVQKSQDDLLTAAVAKNAPAVVSIVISKNVPLLEVEYVNPFGDNPNYRDFGFRVPVYRQKGTARQEIGAGTGFIVTTDGYILTNNHVVFDNQAEYTVLLSSGKQETAKVIYRDAVSDVALIKISGGPYAKADLGTSSSIKLGQTVVAIGNALGEYNNSVSVGIISGMNRNVTATDASGRAENLNDVIQTDAAINPGNSGGPLLDLNGKVIGLNVATVSGASNIGFAVPIDKARSIVEEVTGS